MPDAAAASNAQIADVLDTLADLLEIEDANPFRVRAYRNAARTVREHGKSVAALHDQGEDLSELPNIGADLAEKIGVIAETGTLPLLEEVKARTPAALSDLMHHVEGLGPKRVKLLYKSLDIRSMAQLEAAATEGALRDLPGFGEKLEQRILQRLQQLAGPPTRTLLADAEDVARPLLAHLESARGLERVTAAGSYRRRRETVGDLDIVASAADSGRIMDRFTRYKEVQDVVSRGETRSTVRLRNGMQVDLRVVPSESYGAALLYFTGSKAHNIALRKRAVARGYKINEYGVFEGDARVAGTTEEEIYRLMGLAYVPPELREDRGEIAAAESGQLPELIEIDDIRGDLHCHTRATDGHDTLARMAGAASQLGYAYLAVTDHSRRAPGVRGLDERELEQRLAAVDELNAASRSGLVVLKAVEVNILEDGSLDLADETLQRVDLTVCSVHERLDLPRRKQTERILRAMDNPFFNILGHPTGRRVNQRESYPLDIERVLNGAKERGCFIELNGRPDRMDPSDEICKLAKDMGVLLALATDAHRAAELKYMRYAVDHARRGWLSAKDVLNTRPLDELRGFLKR